jgi:hypothetical protein
VPDIFGPPSSGWGAPKVDFSWLSQLPTDFYKGAQDKQNYDLSRAFQGGLPTDANGMPDYRAVMAKLAQMGDINAISALSQPALQQSQTQQAQQLSPLLSPGAPAAAGAPNPAAAPPQAGAMPAPQPIPASSLPADIPPASAAGAQRTTGAATVDELVASVAPGDKGKTVAANVAKALKVSPDAPLTPEQVERARRLVSGYAQRTGVELPGSGLLARGLRNANPTNIEAGPFAASQPGYVGSDGRFAKFATPEQGIQAAATLLSRYGKGGINTVDKIIAKWAPSSDGNNVANYSKFVAKQIGVEPNQPLDMKDPQTLLKLAGAMSEFENGTKGAAPSAPASHAIIPQVPLPTDPRTGKQFADPQQAILAIDQEMARLSVNPRAAGQVAALKDYRDRIAESTQPLSVGAATTLVDPRTGETVFRGAYAQGGGMLNGQALDAAAENYYQTGKFPPNLGRGMQGSATMNAVMTRAAELHPDANWAERPSAWQQFGTRASGLRTLEQRSANLTLAETEAKSLIPRVKQASDRVSRTEYPTLNSVILAAEKGSGDQNVIRLGIAAESLIRTYARVLKPTGQLSVSDVQAAHDILDKAWSKGQIDAALDQMQIEIDAAKESLSTARHEYGEGGHSESTSRGAGQGAQPQAAPASPSAPKAVGTKAEYDALPRGAEYIAPDGSTRIKQ